MNECVYVGDSPISDIIGANEAGMKTIWYPNGALWPEDRDNIADAEISSLLEILEFIDDWR